MTGPYVSVKKVWNKVGANEIKKRQPGTGGERERGKRKGIRKDREKGEKVKRKERRKDRLSEKSRPWKTYFSTSLLDQSREDAHSTN